MRQVLGDSNTQTQSSRHVASDKRPGRVHAAPQCQCGLVGIVRHKFHDPGCRGGCSGTGTCSRLPAETAAAMRGVVAVARKLNTTKLKENSAVLTPSAPCKTNTAAESSFMLHPCSGAMLRRINVLLRDCNHMLDKC